MKAKALILAAGKGTRMKTDLPKVLVPFKGTTIIEHLLDSVEEAGFLRPTLVVGHRAEVVKNHLKNRCTYVLQEQQLGMAHAVEKAKSFVIDSENLFISVGDSPLLKSSTIKLLVEEHCRTGAVCSFLTGIFDEPLPYARVVRNNQGNIIKCVEQRSAFPHELPIKELFTSHYFVRTKTLFDFLPQISPHPITGERYLTDIIDIFIKEGFSINGVKISNPFELVGLNTPKDVSWAEQK